MEKMPEPLNLDSITFDDSTPLVSSPTGSATSTVIDPDDITDPNDVPVFGHSNAWQAREPQWVPKLREDRKGRTLVLCFDGTGDRFHDRNSNVIKFVELMQKDDTTKQMVYYQTGIGTTSKPVIESSRVMKTISKALDLMFATTLEIHIRDGYEFLCQHYRRGDTVCIFGFSRGAYTARALAGMIQKVGVLPPGNMGMIPFAYEMYCAQDENTVKNLAPGFKAAFSADVKIEFVGVWDTVKSVGLIPRKNLPFVTSNSSIRYFRHALALDEHRVKFVPSYYKPPAPTKEPKPWDGKITTGLATAKQYLAPELLKSHKNVNRHRRDNSMAIDTKSKHTDSLEVWFAGSHCDVGGGSVANSTRHSLARIPLRWMIRECFRCKTGIIFNGDLLRNELGIEFNTENDELIEPAEIAKRILPDESKERIVIRKANGEQGFSLSDIVLFIIGLPLYVISKLLGLMSLLIAQDEHESDASSAPLSPQYKANPVSAASEVLEELHDAISPIHDELVLSPFWWFLEFLPLTVEKELRKFGRLQNWGEGRNVYKFMIDRKMVVHRSVLTRLSARDQWGERLYHPKARPTLGERSERRPHDEWRTENPDADDWFRWYDPVVVD